jgi:pyocin large subunit-like protein
MPKKPCTDMVRGFFCGILILAMQIILRIIVAAIIGTIIFALIPSSKQKAETVAVVATEEASQSHGIKAQSFAPGQLQAHFLKHSHEFGAITEADYLEAAQKLLNEAPGPDLLEKRRSNGDVLRYRPSSREFAVMTDTGRIRTYFIADNPRYWEKQ